MENTKILNPATVESIIAAVYSNPMRRLFSHSKFGVHYIPLLSEDLSQEKLEETVQKKLGIACQKFNEKQLDLHDTSRIDPKIDAIEWKNNLGMLNWYGPFGLQGNIYLQTATRLGNFEGYCLQLCVDESSRQINLHFFGKESEKIGRRLHFKNC